MRGGNPSQRWRCKDLVSCVHPKCALKMPLVSPRTSKRARQAAKAEVRKLLDELWDAQLLNDQFRKNHNEAQRTHSDESVGDPERWRGAVERSAIVVIAVKKKLKAAVEVLKSTYKNPEAFAGLDERFWTPPKLLQAHDAMNQYRIELFLKMTEGKAERS